MCVIAVAPLVGPEGGGTHVTLLLSGSIDPQHTMFYCAFGDEIVPALSHAFRPAGAALAMTCAAPPSDGADDVVLSFSLDGAMFSPAGALFHYHTALRLGAVAPAGQLPLGGGVQVTALLAGPPPFGPGFDPKTTTVPAACFFGAHPVPAEFDAAAGAVACVAPRVASAAALQARGPRPAPSPPRPARGRADPA